MTIKEAILNSFCDDCFENDSDIEKYCKEKLIPLENGEAYE